MNSKFLTRLLASGLTLAVVSHAQVLMLDFGPTAPTSATTNSPYHTAAPSFTDTIWNVVGVGNVASGLHYADNAAATGVSLTLGSAVASVGTPYPTLLLGTAPTSSNALGTVTNTGVYAGNSVGKDAIYSGNNSSNKVIGLQIGGLSGGTYDIYITARNTNVPDNVSYTQAVFAGVSASSGDFAYSGYGSSVLTYASPAAASSFTGSWVQNENYVKLSVTLTSGDVLNLAVVGNGGDTRGFLNSVQVVNTSAIPEPATYAALCGLALLGFAAAFRRRLA